MTQAQPGGSPSSLERVDVIGSSFPLEATDGCPLPLLSSSICLIGSPCEPHANRTFAKRLVSGSPDTQSSSNRRRDAAGAAPDRRHAGRHLRSAHGTPHPQENTTALVTGSSSGIGAEIARDLARRGHGVTLVARREDRLKALADELAADHHVRAEVIAADLTDADSRAALPGELERRGLTVDILVNNAGFSTMGPVHLSDREAELAMVRTNVEAVVDLCTLFVAGMVTRHRGAILNTASTAAFQPLPGPGGLRRVQVVRPLLRPGARHRAQGHRRHRDHAVPGPGRDRLRRGVRA